GSIGCRSCRGTSSSMGCWSGRVCLRERRRWAPAAVAVAGRSRSVLALATARAARAATRAEVSSAGGSTVAAGLAAEASVMTGSGPVVTALVSAVAGLACLPDLGAVEVAGEGAVSAWGAGFACLVVLGFLGLAGVPAFFCRDLL